MSKKLEELKPYVVQALTQGRQKNGYERYMFAPSLFSNTVIKILMNPLLVLPF